MKKLVGDKIQGHCGLKRVTVIQNSSIGWHIHIGDMVDGHLTDEKTVIQNHIVDFYRKLYCEQY